MSGMKTIKVDQNNFVSISNSVLRTSLITATIVNPKHKKDIRVQIRMLILGVYNSIIVN